MVALLPLVLLGIDLLLATPDSPPPQDAVTVVPLSSGRRLFLAGEYRVRDTLPGEYALLFYPSNCDPDRDLHCLDAGSNVPRRIHDAPVKQNMGGPVSWSAGFRTAFVWLDQKKQLTAIDMETEQKRSLTHFPSHRGPSCFPNYLDPGPADDRVIHDPRRNRVLLVVSESVKDPPAGSSGCEHWLAAIDLASGQMRSLSGDRRLPGTVEDWDLSLRRGELFVLTGIGKDSTELLVWSLEGRLLRNITLPREGADAIALSPSGKTLLIERSFRPGMSHPESCSGSQEVYRQYFHARCG